MTGWLVLLCSIALNIAGNLLVKASSARGGASGAAAYLSLPFALGVAAFALGVVFYGRALRDIPIVLAYPIQVGASVLVIALFAVFVFGEKFGVQTCIGILLVLGGIAVLSRVA